MLVPCVAKNLMSSKTRWTTTACWRLVLGGKVEKIENSLAIAGALDKIGNVAEIIERAPHEFSRKTKLSDD